MINICIDIRYLTEKGSGVARYIKNLTEKLIETNDGRFSFFLLGQDSNFKLLKADKSAYKIIDSRFDPVKHPFSDIWFNTLFITLLKKNNIQIFHSLAFFIPFCKLPCRLITTIHDRVAKAFPETLPFFFRHYLDFHVKKAVKKSDIIITMSEFSKKELEKEFKSFKKIAVIPLGCEQKNLPVSVINKQNYPYMLVVGNIEPRKGIADMIRGYELFREKNPSNSEKLVFCGQTLWGYDEPEKLAGFSKFRDSIVFTGFVSEEELISLYMNSKLTIVPSLYEGFGLPVLEAMRAKAPILINDIDVLSEVGGDIVYRTKIQSPAELACKLKELLEDKCQKINYYQKYNAYLKSFTWEACAFKTRNLYEECALQ